MKQTLLVSLALTAGFGAALGMPAEHGPAWVDHRVQQWQPTAKERQWEQTGWVTGLADALRLARMHRRPVFLFTHDGRLNVARC